MKARIIGLILVLVVLGGIVVLFPEAVNSDGNQHVVPQSSQQSDPDANALKGLKIN